MLFCLHCNSGCHFLCILGSLEDCGSYSVHSAPQPKIYMWYTMTATFRFLNVEMFSHNLGPQNFPTFPKLLHLLHFFSFPSPIFLIFQIRKSPKILNQDNY